MNPGDLSWLRAAIFAQLEQPRRALTVAADRRLWLDWLEVPVQTGSAAFEKSEDLVAPTGLQVDCAELRAAGFLPEVVYACLVQTWWHPGQSDWVARTRSEILACYSPAECERPGWALNWEALARVNAYRLQELTPEELLSASRDFWPEPADPAELESMEAWVLLHLESFQRLQDVADCLQPFWKQTVTGLERPELESLLAGAEPSPGAAAWLHLPAGVEWSLARGILGEARLQRWAESAT